MSRSALGRGLSALMEDPVIPQDATATPQTPGPVRGPGAAVTQMLHQSNAEAVHSSTAMAEEPEPLVQWSLWAADIVLVAMGVFLLRQTPLHPEFWKEWILGTIAMTLGCWLAILALPSSPIKN